MQPKRIEPANAVIASAIRNWMSATAGSTPQPKPVIPGHTNALWLVMDRPTMRVFISRVPS
jgi:hypothetical protein